MFQLDDKFLQDVGLDQLPADQKQAFLELIAMKRPKLNFQMPKIRHYKILLKN